MNMYYALHNQGATTMLKQFSFRNFKSFSDDTIIDFTASSKCQELPGFVIKHRNEKYLPCIALFGANASGKSNVVEAFARMFEIVRNAHTDNYSVIVPFIFDENLRAEPTEFEVILVMDKFEYRYGIQVNNLGILREWLYIKHSGSRYSHEEESIIFVREENNIVSLSNEIIDFDTDKFVSANISYLSVLGDKKHHPFDDVYNWFRLSNAFHASFLEDNSRALRMAAEIINNVSIVYDFCREFIREFDPCIEDIHLIEDIDKDQIPYRKIMTKHVGYDKDLSINIESAGTKKLLMTLVHISTALNFGTILLIDELDSRLHPLLLREIVSMFHDPAINIGHGQLMFTSHNVTLLDGECLRRDEIWFSEKNIDGKSCLYTLIDIKLDGIKRVRSDLRYMRNYLLGKFGAIPFRKDVEICSSTQEKLEEPEELSKNVEELGSLVVKERRQNLSI